MRVIAGAFRGRKLSTVKSLAVRPTTDRAKQVIFDVLASRIDFDGLTVLDLFAGSGSLGIEAMSRGASSVIFVERSKEALAVLEQNIRTLGLEKQSELIRGDMYAFVTGTRMSYDLVFVDPPYDLPRIEELPNRIADSGVVNQDGWVVMEHRSSSHVAPPTSQFRTIRKELGQTIALIMQYCPHSMEQSEGTS